MEKVNRVQKSIALPDYMVREIEERSRREHRSFSNMAEVILEEALTVKEGATRQAVAEAR